VDHVSALHCRAPEFRRSAPNNPKPQSFSDKSGNKLPTIVQKVYMRLGKKVHELLKKFFPAAFVGLPLSISTYYLVSNVL
jgi:hypothetical protein